MGAQAQARDELSALGYQVLERLDAVVDAMGRRVRQELPFYAGGDLPAADLRRSIHDNLEPVLRSLSASVPLDLGPARATGRERAEQDAPLPDVLRAFRLGFELLWQDLVETAWATGHCPERPQSHLHLTKYNACVRRTVPLALRTQALCQLGFSAWVRVSQATKRSLVPAGRLDSVRAWVLAMAMPRRVCRAL